MRSDVKKCRNEEVDVGAAVMRKFGAESELPANVERLLVIAVDGVLLRFLVASAIHARKFVHPTEAAPPSAPASFSKDLPLRIRNQQ
jgi:hypothetical protein